MSSARKTCPIAPLPMTPSSRNRPMRLPGPFGESPFNWPAVASRFDDGSLVEARRAPLVTFDVAAGSEPLSSAVATPPVEVADELRGSETIDFQHRLDVPVRAAQYARTRARI